MGGWRSFAWGHGLMWGHGVALSSVFAPGGDGEMRADELGASPGGWPARLAHGTRGSGGRYCSRDSKGGGVGLGTCGMDAWQRHTQRRGRQQRVHARRRAARVLQGGAGGGCTHRAVFVACGAERAGVAHAQARWAHERRMPRWRSPGHAGKMAVRAECAEVWSGEQSRAFPTDLMAPNTTPAAGSTHAPHGWKSQPCPPPSQPAPKVGPL